MNKTTASPGFTLIELMITVAVVAILAAVAYPAYTDHVRKSRRAEAQAYLSAVAQKQGLMLLAAPRKYVALEDIGIPVPATVTAAYDLAASVPDVSPPTFSVTATPRTSQSSDPCGTLGIDHNQVKTAAKTGCW